MFNINGKVALLTGGAGGIGQSIAKELLKHGLKGISLVDIDVNRGQEAAKELEEEFGTGCAIFVKADITDEAQFTDAFESTTKVFKQLDIVINNAGIVQEIQWRKCVAVNLGGVITGSKLAMEKYLPEFKSGEEGLLINIASELGITALEEMSVYAATKSGVIGFSRSIGGPLHYEKYRVRVLTVCPGLTNTAISILTEEQQIDLFRERLNHLLNIIPFQRTEDFAQQLIPIIGEAPFGSVWTIINGTRKEVQFPKLDD